MVIRYKAMVEARSPETGSRDRVTHAFRNSDWVTQGVTCDATFASQRALLAHKRFAHSKKTPRGIIDPYQPVFRVYVYFRKQ